MPTNSHPLKVRLPPQGRKYERNHPGEPSLLEQFCDFFHRLTTK